MGPQADVKPVIGVVGLWHLGCTIAASWAQLGYFVRAVDPDTDVIAGLQQGRAPLHEPGLDGAFQAALYDKQLDFSASFSVLQGCRFVFVAYDTPVRDDDTSDLDVIFETFSRLGPVLDAAAIVVVSSQLPVGTSRVLRAGLKRNHPLRELVYSPENLRLGEALACYRQPGHIVIGADDRDAAVAVETLFAPMNAQCLHMNLPSAEMAKHGINSFLAASITLANQWADLCTAAGADWSHVAEAMKYDPRIGKRAYLSAGIGFSGGTLGRDLRVLDQLNKEQADDRCPIFGGIWRYNKERVSIVRQRTKRLLGSLEQKTVALLGLTYKPGTSTLRRSLPLAVAEDLFSHGATLRVYDPKADWRECPIPPGMTVCASPYEAAQGADLLIVLTEWPEFQSLDYGRVKSVMAQANLFDTKDLLRSSHQALSQIGFQVLTIGRG